ncbi:class I SAM-dependent methyltransferase [Bradyrhizobium sp.]|uniref:class I SAM-dependent methyltransferase n=1 Tax=Bradyrhizobium sp. TaxID=376 RepID=UPI003BB15E7F
MYADVAAYYSACVARHGATPLGVDWSCQATQMLRFVQLLKICDFSAPFTLNDIGCGYGALAAFLAMRYPKSKIDYLGVDLSRAMVSRARRRFSGPDRRFVVGKASPRIADYSLASGIMNVNCGHSRTTWEGYIATILRQMRRNSRRGFGVNFVVDAARRSAEPLPDTLYRTSPQPWIRFCERELGCSVETIDDYGMKEFTLLVRCNQTAAA